MTATEASTRQAACAGRRSSAPIHMPPAIAAVAQATWIASFQEAAGESDQAIEANATAHQRPAPASATTPGAARTRQSEPHGARQRERDRAREDRAHGRDREAHR